MDVPVDFVAARGGEQVPQLAAGDRLAVMLGGGARHGELLRRRGSQLTVRLESGEQVRVHRARAYHVPEQATIAARAAAIRASWQDRALRAALRLPPRQLLGECGPGSRRPRLAVSQRGGIKGAVRGAGARTSEATRTSNRRGVARRWPPTAAPDVTAGETAPFNLGGPDAAR